ncbi:MAG: hypothetical protein WCC06_11870 [Candidatus Aminicenantales bacterium]
MNAERNFFCMALLMATLSLALSFLYGERTPKKESVRSRGDSLLLKERLQDNRREYVPPKRDIFSAWRSQGAAAIPPAADEESESSASPAQNVSTANFNVQYIGYIRTPQKFLGLILFEGQALTVTEGEFIGEGIKVLRVTAEEIEIQGPDSKVQRFGLEGDKK